MQIDGRRVLVVDDDTHIRNLLREFLTRCGYVVDCAGNGEEAISFLRSNDYNILITDYMMPGINGIDLIKKIRNLKMSLPVIGISSLHNGRGFLAAGANLFLAKPFILSELKNALQKIPT